MKLIIAGSRDIYTTGHFIDGVYGDLFIFEDDDELEIVSGGAEGIDKAGEHFAKIHSEEVTLKIFPADWKKHGKAAGPIRNRQMAEYADALLLIWDGKSRGSANMKSEMLKLGKPVYEIIVATHNTK